jgi:hypothetical protein
MKFSLVSFLATASIFAVSSAFVVQTPGVGRNSVVLEGSRNAQKKASRSKWIAARGFSEEGGTADAAAVETGLMTNSDGLEYVKLVHPDTGASSEIYLFGGDVTSYKDADGTEFIAVRPDAKMDGSKPISGGLSHCFPQVKLGWSSYMFLLPTFNRLTVSFLSRLVRTRRDSATRIRPQRQLDLEILHCYLLRARNGPIGLHQGHLGQGIFVHLYCLFGRRPTQHKIGRRE